MTFVRDINTKLGPCDGKLAKVEDTKPREYRLATRGDEMVLQGCFVTTTPDYQDVEWRDLPTAVLPPNNQIQRAP